MINALCCLLISLRIRSCIEAGKLDLLLFSFTLLASLSTRISKFLRVINWLDDHLDCYDKDHN